jgi:competence protein ComEA
MLSHILAGKELAMKMHGIMKILIICMLSAILLTGCEKETMTMSGNGAGTSSYANATVDDENGGTGSEDADSSVTNTGDEASQEEASTTGEKSVAEASDSADKTSAGDETAAGKASVTDSEEENQPGTVKVFVCGAVLQEGVYTLKEGSRIDSALKLAGGFAQDADTDYVNLAETVEDGQKIYFPREGEEVTEAQSKETATTSSSDATGSQGQENSALVNINAADIEGLKTLPDIGETRAQRILAYRQSNGNFASKEDIKNVSGIGDSIYESIKDYITVD